MPWVVPRSNFNLHAVVLCYHSCSSCNFSSLSHCLSLWWVLFLLRIEIFQLNGCIVDFCLGVLVSKQFVVLGFGLTLHYFQVSAMLHLACNRSLDSLMMSLAIYSQCLVVV